ncbi:MAG: CBS domain-containing protein, partial [Dongiaceae bacterium]
MAVRAIMTPDPVTLRADDSIGHAADLMLSRRFVNLPIVEHDRRYRAMFGVFELVGLLLPPGSTIDHLVPDLDFIAESMPDLVAKLDEIKGNPVGAHGRADLPRLKPDTPILAALLLFHRHRSSLPVVEPDSGQLVG